MEIRHETMSFPYIAAVRMGGTRYALYIGGKLMEECRLICVRIWWLVQKKPQN